MTEQQTILVVDDEPDIRELLVLEFELLKYRVLEAENGRRAFEITRNEQVDVVVSDIRMPGGDGITLLKELRKADPFSPPMVLITGFADISTPQAFDAGADSIYMKPFSLAELVSSVKKSLRPIEQRAETLATAPTALLKRKWDAFPGERTKEFSIGHGGFFLSCASPVPKRESAVTFDLEFGTGPLSRLCGTGTVRWSDLNGIWVEIDGLTKESQKSFKDFVLARRDSSFIPLPA